MRGIILAAGRGLRLNGITGDNPKCLVRIGGLTLIERQIQTLRRFEIDDIAVVVGYGADRVRRACGSEVSYIENELFDQTNSLYSLWMTRDLLREGFVVMNSDVLFHPQLLKDLLTARHEDALLIAYSSESKRPLGSEEMKVKVRGGRVVDISKLMDPAEADGENLGIVKFGASGAELLVEKMDTLIAAKSYRDWAPRAFRDFAAERPLFAVGTRGYPWTEIDFPEDYRLALDEIWPSIEAMDEGYNNARIVPVSCGSRPSDRQPQLDRV
jgi:choline kinase